MGASASDRPDRRATGCVTRGDDGEGIPGDESIGKFDILATYTYAKALHDGLDDDEAKRRGMVAAVMGARARMGHAQGGRREEKEDDYHRRVVRSSGLRQ